MAAHPSIAITAGEPAGIGPELIAMLAARHAQHPFPARLVVLGDKALLAERARRIDAHVLYANYDPLAFAPVGGSIEVWNQPLAAPAVPGHPDPTNARSVLSMLEAGCDACATGAFAALVTGPVQKSAMQDAGIPFSGHTEFFAERTHTHRVVMMLTTAGASPLRVALVTTHLPLRDVPAAITADAVRETLAIVRRGLIDQFDVANPRLAVCGLNPHAGEGGHLGREDIDIIAPAIEAARIDGVECDRTAARRHRVRARCRPSVRCDRRDVPRPGTAGTEGGELRHTASTSRSACRLSARPSITGRRSISPSTRSARRQRTSAASSPPSISPSKSLRAPATDRPGMQGHQPRKRFGQNFLADAHYVAEIVAAIDLRPATTSSKSVRA